MKEALINIVLFHLVNKVFDRLMRFKKLKITRVIRASVSVFIFVALFAYQTQEFIKNKPDNYFEILNQESSMPSPILVKRQYK